jgi:hypothetical protein
MKNPLSDRKTRVAFTDNPGFYISRKIVSPSILTG